MNFQQQTDEILNHLNGTPRLLLHSCCGPCSSYVLEYLSHYFSITILFYNPCIHPAEEFEHRLTEQKRLIAETEYENPISLLIPPYEPEHFFEVVKGYEHCPEGGERCKICFTQRLQKTADIALAQHFDYFATTLTVSPHKNALVINAVGRAAERETGVVYLPSDFKKKNGYQRSLELSRKHHLYRQNYCGCVFSKAANGGQL